MMRVNSKFKKAANMTINLNAFYSISIILNNLNLIGPWLTKFYLRNATLKPIKFVNIYPTNI